MSTPRALIFSGYGLNCEDETKVAFELAGAKADIVHINDLIANRTMLRRYQIVALPGGFSYGDDTGSGKAFGRRIVHNLRRELNTFLKRDTLMIGICNGFQILTAAGILPGALISNDSGRYLCRWVDVEVAGESPWLIGLGKLSIPIAHGEGKYYDSEEKLNGLEQSGSVALRYVSGEICEYQNLPGNPNGALRDIAGVTSRDGRILGMMPHPERGMFFTQLPHWTHLRENYRRSGKPLPTYAAGIEIFRNAVRYFT